MSQKRLFLIFTRRTLLLGTTSAADPITVPEVLRMERSMSGKGVTITIVPMVMDAPVFASLNLGIPAREPPVPAVLSVGTASRRGVRAAMMGIRRVVMVVRVRVRSNPVIRVAVSRVRAVPCVVMVSRRGVRGVMTATRQMAMDARVPAPLKRASLAAENQVPAVAFVAMV